MKLNVLGSYPQIPRGAHSYNDAPAQAERALAKRRREGAGRREPVRIVRIIREVAEYYSLPVLDLFRLSGMQPEIEEIKTRYMPDGLHPSDAGNERIAELLEGFLLSL